MEVRATLFDIMVIIITVILIITITITIISILVRLGRPTGPHSLPEHDNSWVKRRNEQIAMIESLNKERRNNWGISIWDWKGGIQKGHTWYGDIFVNIGGDLEKSLSIEVCGQVIRGITWQQPEESQWNKEIRIWYSESQKRKIQERGFDRISMENSTQF